jgi:hypothetical protein
LPVTTIFVAVFVFDADLYAPPRSIIVVASIVSVAVRAIPASIVVSIVAISVSTAILVRITIFVAVAPPHFWTHVAVVPEGAVAVATAHAPVATHLALVAPRLAPVGSLITGLLGILVSGSSRYALRSRDRRLPFTLGE